MSSLPTSFDQGAVTDPDTDGADGEASAPRKESSRSDPQKRGVAAPFPGERRMIIPIAVDLPSSWSLSENRSAGGEGFPTGIDRDG